MKNKKLLLWIVSVVALTALVVGMLFLWNGSREQPVEGLKEITVIVVHKDQSEKTFTIETESDYLDNALMAEGLIAGDMSDYGIMIHTVDGEKADWNVDQGWWQILVGDEPATEGASYLAIEDGDVFRLVYTVGEG